MEARDWAAIDGTENEGLLLHSALAFVVKPLVATRSRRPLNP